MSYLGCTTASASCWGSHEDARSTLRRLVHATAASLAEMDRLLDKAERLGSREPATGRPTTATDQRHHAVGECGGF